MEDKEPTSCVSETEIETTSCHTDTDTEWAKSVTDEETAGIEEDLPLTIVQPKKKVRKYRIRVPRKGPRRYKCSKCNYTCLSPAKLNFHLEENKGGKTYECLECPFKFCNPRLVKVHHNRVHRQKSDPPKMKTPLISLPDVGEGLKRSRGRPKRPPTTQMPTPQSLTNPPIGPIGIGSKIHKDVLKAALLDRKKGHLKKVKPMKPITPPVMRKTETSGSFWGERPIVFLCPICETAMLGLERLRKHLLSVHPDMIPGADAVDELFAADGYMEPRLISHPLGRPLTKKDPINFKNSNPNKIKIPGNSSGKVKNPGKVSRVYRNSKKLPAIPDGFGRSKAKSLGRSNVKNLGRSNVKSLGMSSVECFGRSKDKSFKVSPRPMQKPREFLGEKFQEKKKSFGCGFCAFRANSRQKVEDHERVHTGEKPYECTECYARFGRLSYVQKHWIKHHCAEI